MLYLAMQCSWLLELLHFWFSIWRHPAGIWRDPSGIWRHPSGFLRDPSGCAFCLNQDKSQLQFLFFPQREGVSFCAVRNTMGAIVCCFNEANKLKNRRFLCRTIVLTRTQCAKTHTRTQNTRPAGWFLLGNLSEQTPWWVRCAGLWLQNRANLN